MLIKTFKVNYSFVFYRNLSDIFSKSSKHSGGLDKNLNEKTTEEIMEESPPIITKNTKLPVITSLLKFYPIPIIQDSGKLVGIITKADIIKHL